MLGGVFRVHCIFPYMEGEAVLNIKIREKSKKCCQGPVYMSKKGNSGVSTEKIVKNSQKVRETEEWYIHHKALHSGSTSGSYACTPKRKYHLI